MHLTLGTLNQIFLNKNRVLFFSVSFFIFILSFQALASPKSLTYQGRILKSDGAPLEYSNVSFIFQITDPLGQCVIYQEQVNGINMSNSAGIFDVPIGLGAIQYPLGGTTNILDIFNNSGSFTCGACSYSNGTYSCTAATSTYTANSGDGRKLRVSFYDGSGWKLITPDNTIRSVPFAGYALSAEKLGTNVASDFLTKAGLPKCDNGTFLSYDGTSLSCAAVSGVNGGTVTNVTSSNSYLTVINGNSTPALTVNVGTIANTVAAGNDPRFTDARTPTGAASGILNGTYPNPGLADNTVTNTKISDAAISTSKLFANPGVNRLVATDATTGSTLSALTCAAGQLLTWNVVSGWQCSNQNSLAVGSATIAGSATNFSGSLVGDVSGTQSATSVDKIKGVPLDFSAAPVSGQVLKFNGTSWAPAIDNNAGGTVTSVSATAPISVVTGASTPVISISQATTSTNGYLSSTDWNNFNNKQTALGFTPLNPANNLGDVASVSISRTNLGLGTAAVKNFPAAGNAAATEVVLGSDSRLSDSRTPTGSAGGDLTGTYPNPTLTTTGVAAGTYTKVTVDTKGRVTASASLSATDIPNLDWSKITTGKPTTLSGYGITDSLVVNGGTTGKISSGLDASKPASPATGDLFIATDAKRIYRYTGTTWDQLADASSTGGITALTGDVSATGPGSVAATVNNVGGKSASAIAISVNDTAAATNSNTVSTIVKRDASGNFAANNATLSSVTIKDGQATPNTVTLQTPTAITTNYVLKFPTAQGSSNQLMINDGSGNLSWTTLSSMGGVTSVTAAGTAGNPITVGGTATAPTVDIAKATSTTNGYLSSADWTTFNNKQSASLADAKIWVGQTGTPTAVTPGGDVSMTNAGAFTVTSIRGKTVSTTAPTSSGQVLRYDGTSTYIPAFLGIADIKSSITPFGGAFASSACTAGQSLYWQSSTDTFQCQSIAISDSQLSFSTSRTANTFLAAPNGSAGAATFRTIASADLPTGTLSGSGTTGYVPYYSAGTTLANSPMYVSGANVGIGTTNPVEMLHVNGNINIPYVFKLKATGNTANNNLLYNYYDGSYDKLEIAATGNSRSHIGFLTSASNATAPTEVMTISSSGNVGIGTTSPSWPLQIISTNAATSGIQYGFTEALSVNPTATSTAGTAAAYFSADYKSTSDLTSSGIYGIEGYAQHTTAATINSATGGYGDVVNQSTGTITAGKGLRGIVSNNSTGSIGTAYGLEAYINNASTGTITNSYELYLNTANSGTITNQYGVYQATSSSKNYLAAQVGIGTTNPLSKLDVNGAIAVGTFAGTSAAPGNGIAVSGSIYAGQSTAQPGLYNPYTTTYSFGPKLQISGLSSDTSSAALMSFQSNAAGPNLVLAHTRGDTLGSQTILQSGDEIGGIAFEGSDGSNGFILASKIKSTVAGTPAAGDVAANLVFQTRPSGGPLANRMLIDSTGNVGIGTTNPAAQLDVYQAGNLATTVNISTPGTQAAQQSNLNLITKADGNILGTATNRGWSTIGRGDAFTGQADLFAISYWNGSAWNQSFNISPAGKVGIGTTSPSNLLTVSGVSPYIGINSTSATDKRVGVMMYSQGTSQYEFGVDVSANNTRNFYLFDSVAANTRLLVDSAGNVGIGTISPGYKLDVQGGGVNASGGYTQTSDIRLKTNVEYLDSNKALEKITMLNGIYYDWKDQNKFGSDHQIGLIAQDVQKVFPEAVKTNSEGFLSVSYSNLVAPTIEAIKELLKISKEHEREIASVSDKTLKLETENVEIKAENAQLKARADKAEKENSEIKAYLCSKDPNAPICK